MPARPLFYAGSRWALNAGACLGLGLLMSTTLVVGQTTGPGVYRCGNSYSNTPCPGGAAIDTDDARSASQREAAQAATRRDAALADQMAAERRAREQQAARQPAIGIVPTPASAPQAKKKTTQKKPKPATYKSTSKPKPVAATAPSPQ